MECNSAPIKPSKPSKPEKPQKPVKNSTVLSEIATSDGRVSVANPFCKLKSQSAVDGKTVESFQKPAENELGADLEIETSDKEPKDRIKSVFSTKSFTKSLKKALSPIRQSLRPDNAATIDENLIKEGILSKMNRDGKFERYSIRLTKDEFIYKKEQIIETSTAEKESAEDTSKAVGEDSHDSHAIPLSTILVMEIAPLELVDNEKRERVFKLCSKQKSFFLRGKTVDLKQVWYDEILQAVSEVQSQPGNRVICIEDTAPIWTTGDANCYICGKQFSFFVRRHHCRNCGRCVCEPCSPDKTRILKIDDKKLYKVCNPCGQYLKNNRKYGAREQNRGDVVEGTATAET